jgi:transcriptional regulator with XRE-family HTH domain
MLREARVAANLSQVDLAKKIGETQSYVSKCERGERRLDVIQLRKVCEALDTTLMGFVAEFETRLGRRRR